MRTGSTMLRVLAMLMLLSGICVTFAQGIAAQQATDQSQPLVAYTKDDNVWLMNADGSGQHPLTTDGVPILSTDTPSTVYPWYEWSPDGRYLLIVRDHRETAVAAPDNGRDFLLYDSETNKIDPLATSLPRTIYLPSWANDANLIAFVTNQNSNPGEEFTYPIDQVDLAGQRSHLVDVPGKGCGFPSGSPLDPAFDLLMKEEGTPFLPLAPSISWNTADQIVTFQGCHDFKVAHLVGGGVQDIALFNVAVGPANTIAAHSSGSPDLILTQPIPGAAQTSLGPGGTPAWSAGSGDLYYVQREQVGEIHNLQSADRSGMSLGLQTYQSTLWHVNADGTDHKRLIKRTAYAFGRPSPAADGSFVVFTRIDNATELWDHRLPGDTYNTDLLKKYGPRARIQRLDRGAGKETTLVSDAFRPVVQPLAVAGPGPATATPATPEPAASPVATPGSTAIPSAGSADNPLVAFRKDGDIWLMNSDGSNRRPLTTNGRMFGETSTGDQASYTTYPAHRWSSDGQYLLVVRDNGLAGQNPSGQTAGTRALLLYDPATGAFKELARGLPLSRYLPNWAVDGNEIAYVSAERYVPNRGSPVSVTISRIDLNGQSTTIADLSTTVCGFAELGETNPALNLYYAETAWPIYEPAPAIQWSLDQHLLLFDDGCDDSDLLNLDTGDSQLFGMKWMWLSPAGQLLGHPTGQPGFPPDLVITVPAPSDQITKVGSGGGATWSADGSTAYFTECSQGDSITMQPGGEGLYKFFGTIGKTCTIWRVNADGSGKDAVLKRTVFSLGRLSLSADGQSLYFSRVDGLDSLWEHRLPGDVYTQELLDKYGPRLRIQRLDLQTGHLTTLATGAGRPDVQPVGEPPSAEAVPISPSPNADAQNQASTPTGEIAYQGDDGNIWLIDADGNNPRQITTDGTKQSYYHDPRWSPDGTMLVFARIGLNGISPAILLLRGGTIAQFDAPAGCGPPTFSNDGQRLLFPCGAGRPATGERPSAAQLQTDPALGLISSTALDGSDARVEVAWPANRATHSDFPLNAGTIDIAPDGALLINYVGTKGQPYPELLTESGAVAIDGHSARFTPDGNDLIVAQCSGECHHPRSGYQFTLVRVGQDDATGQTLLTLPADRLPSTPSLSPDGVWLTFATGSTVESNSWMVFVAAASGGLPVAVANGSDPVWQPAPADISLPVATGAGTPTQRQNDTATDNAPSNAIVSNAGPEVRDLDVRLAFGLKRGNHWDVYCYDFATGVTTQLTDKPNSDEWAPAWSHDGEKIAFLSDAADGSNQVWLMNPDGSDQHQITDYHGDGQITYIAWGSDNQSFVLTVGDTQSYRLMTAPVSGGDLQAYMPAPASFASISTFGRMAYVDEIDGKPAVIIVDSVNGRQMGTIGGGGVPFDTPDLADDGQWLVFTYGEKGERRVGVSHLGRPKEHPIPASGGDDSNGVWLSSGAWIAYVSHTESGDSIWAVPLYTQYGVPTQITLPPHDAIWYLAPAP